MRKKVEGVSRFLSYVLRHRPDSLQVELDAEGWANLSELVSRAQAQGKAISRALVEEAVATNDKRRFEISPCGARIRAVQGHTVAVDLRRRPLVPPETLFHGTATRFVSSIIEMGLRPAGRQYVHLSADKETAIAVGSRHGKPAVFRVSSGHAHRDGCSFFLSKNGVWLTTEVAPQYLALVDCND